MLFSSTVFLFIFLPLTIAIYFLLKNNFRNTFLLFASLFFYAWGEQQLVLLMICSICINFLFGNIISNNISNKRIRKAKANLTISISINIAVLVYYKYFHFIISNLSFIGFDFNLNTSNITLPIGISFFTFQSISYLIDVYKQRVSGQKNIINLGMYIALFPQLIAGPIIRYSDINKEINTRKITLTLFNSGIRRFISGLAKKVIIANNVGLIADSVFAIAPVELSTKLSWIGIVCYTLQIYYDFSGYSDMAIGLGKMFGFNFKENFDHPYSSTSIQEFWRKWHISLSSWFKDYLYIPLGGNRKGETRTYINLLIVFLVTGLWHGANWTFIVWGLFHGAFLIFERLGLLTCIPKVLDPLKRVYTLLIVLIGWVIFRAETLDYALSYIGKMFSFSTGTNQTPYLYINSLVVTILIIGVLFSLPIKKHIVKVNSRFNFSIPQYTLIKHLSYLIIFIASICELAQSTYNPFIYFRF